MGYPFANCQIVLAAISAMKVTAMQHAAEGSQASPVICKRNLFLCVT